MDILFRITIYIALSSINFFYLRLQTAIAQCHNQYVVLLFLGTTPFEGVCVPCTYLCQQHKFPKSMLATEVAIRSSNPSKSLLVNYFGFIIPKTMRSDPQVFIYHSLGRRFNRITPLQTYVEKAQQRLSNRWENYLIGKLAVCSSSNFAKLRLKIIFHFWVYIYIIDGYRTHLLFLTLLMTPYQPCSGDEMRLKL